MANQAAIQPAAYKTGAAAIGTANTSETSAVTGGVVLYTPTTAANGGANAKIVTIRAQATGTTTAGRLKFWRYDGVTYYRLFDIAVTAVTPSASVPGWSTTLLSGSGANPLTGEVACDITVKIGDTLMVSTYNAETFNVTCDAIEYGGI